MDVVGSSVTISQKTDRVDAAPDANKANRDSEDARPTGKIPQSIPVRKGSLYLDTPNSPHTKVYSMTGAKRGKVLIFNQVTFDDSDYPERIGTDKDVERLYNVLPRLGFDQKDILVFRDYSCTEINRTAVKLEHDEELEQADCLVVVILTHGEEGDMLMAQDDSYHLYKFLENFTPTSLNSMAGKPKLFIVQSCRGKKLDRGVQLRAKTLKTDSVFDSVDSQSHSKIFSYPEFADFLIVMSSHYGHYSFRNETGSWLIQDLCNVIESCDLETSSIYDILTETNSAVSVRISNADGEQNNKKQIPSFYSTLTKKLFFTSK